ncbi:MAG: hypothetical protein BJ554DRAFT_7343, partial [Olpidium bornovanus]
PLVLILGLGSFPKKSLELSGDPTNGLDYEPKTRVDVSVVTGAIVRAAVGWLIGGGNVDETNGCPSDEVRPGSACTTDSSECSTFSSVVPAVLVSPKLFAYCDPLSAGALLSFNSDGFQGESVCRQKGVRARRLRRSSAVALAGLAVSPAPAAPGKAAAGRSTGAAALAAVAAWDAAAAAAPREREASAGPFPEEEADDAVLPMRAGAAFVSSRRRRRGAPSQSFVGGGEREQGGR